MSRVVSGILFILRSIERFSAGVVGVELRQYQAEPLEAIIESIKEQAGLEFLLIFPRQSGKNEAAAILIVYLLNLFQRISGTIIFAAIGDGIGRMIGRVEDRLDNKWNADKWTKRTSPPGRALQRYGCDFLSSHPQAAARGATATHLLIVDEMQDQSRTHLEAVFEPMRAANNATAVYMGTVRTDHDALWKKRAELLALQETDGRRRVFFVLPDRVIAENPAYGEFLKNKIARFGRNHPIIASEYFLEPISQADRLLPRRRIQLLTGTEPRQAEPKKSAIYVALIDVGGQDEAATTITAELDNPHRDHTTVTIVEINVDKDQPRYQAADVFCDVGSRHFQQFPGKSALSAQIKTFLQHWNVIHTVIDGTGVGEGLADWLSVQFSADHVTIFKFSKLSKAALGSSLIALIETHRLRYFTERDETGQIQAESAEWWFIKQCEACRYTLPEGGEFDRHLRWGVPAAHQTETAAGTVPTHDDRLLSLALIAIVDDLIKSGAIAIGSAESAVIPNVDPLAELKFQ